MTQSRQRTVSTPLLLLCSPGALPLRKIGLAPGFKVLHLLGYLASRLRAQCLLQADPARVPSAQVGESGQK